MNNYGCNKNQMRYYKEICFQQNINKGPDQQSMTSNHKLNYSRDLWLSG